MLMTTAGIIVGSIAAVLCALSFRTSMRLRRSLIVDGKAFAEQIRRLLLAHNWRRAERLCEVCGEEALLPKWTHALLREKESPSRFDGIVGRADREIDGLIGRLTTFPGTSVVATLSICAAAIYVYAVAGSMPSVLLDLRVSLPLGAACVATYGIIWLRWTLLRDLRKVLAHLQATRDTIEELL